MPTSAEQAAVQGWVTKVETDLPGTGNPITPLTVVRRDAELAFVTAMVEAHSEGLDEYCGDFLDALLEQRHQARLRAIDDQAVLRTQQASDAEAATSQARHEAALYTAAARAELAALERRASRWAFALDDADEPHPSAAPAASLPAAAESSAAVPPNPNLPAGWVWDASSRAAALGGASEALVAPSPEPTALPPDSPTVPAQGPSLRTIGHDAGRRIAEDAPRDVRSDSRPGGESLSA